MTASVGEWAGSPAAWLLLAAYFAPAITAAARKNRNATAIFTMNLLLGWTVLFWIGALIWALTKPQPATKG